ncbi:hypothetical protein EC9_42670 [Rosistilla ulvae]|uniref:Uncharacterized protein n=1 Tax=Rosistilla ulvae TaxID=1930277 RepID=A0A517M5B8_9BACT|nr:hypothetical protein EC9_42670 [Rosistilla ulvae]
MVQSCVASYYFLAEAFSGDIMRAAALRFQVRPCMHSDKMLVGRVLLSTCSIQTSVEDAFTAVYNHVVKCFQLKSTLQT